MYHTLIEADDLAKHLYDEDWVIVDCRFSLADTAAGRAAYEQEHILGAVYAHLDDDLSGPPLTDSGRHPLPSPEALKELFGRLGISNQKTQVITYDDAGSMIASRLWWMLRYMDHEKVAVLNGGWRAWQAAGYPTARGTSVNKPTRFEGQPQREWLVTVEQVPELPLLIDSRDAPRYRGEMEPIDPQAGHIPGAINFPFKQVLDEQGKFLSPEQLQEKFKTLPQTAAPDEATFYCGSGVSACVNLLALQHAGLGNGRLYVGSWSEWSSDPTREIATDN